MTTPPLRDWDQTAALLAALIDEQRQTNLLLRKAHFQDGGEVKFVPTPRPTSAYQRIAEKARTDQRFRKHDDLVRKLLGDRAKKQ